MHRLPYEFYHRPCIDVARDLVGKLLVRRTEQGEIRLRISETEVYWGENDTACHASKGRTKRSEVLYMGAGTIYVYLCFPQHSLWWHLYSFGIFIQYPAKQGTACF